MKSLWTAMVFLPAVFAAAGCDNGNGGNGEDADAAETTDLAVDEAGEAADMPGEEETEEDAAEEAQDDGVDVIDDEHEEELVELGGLGDNCKVPSDCESGVCITEILFSGFENGYCTIFDCDPDDHDTCGADGYCIDIASAYPAVCVKMCEDEEGCDEGNSCIGVCLPDAFVSDPEVPDILDSEDELMAAVVAAVDRDRMEERMEIMSGAAQWDNGEELVEIASRSVYHADHALAVDYLASLFTDMGLTVNLLEFTYEDLDLVNIEARLEGTDADADPLYLYGHYDSIASFTSGWNAETDPAPGCVDNGTGVAIVLEIAEIMAGLSATEPAPRDMVFVLFDGEELGLYGSTYYAAAMAEAEEPLACGINVDMVGWTTEATPDRFWYAYNEPDEAVAAIGLEAILDFVSEARPITTHTELFGNSDHWPFWVNGYCASSFSTFPSQPTYHTVGDMIDTVDFDFFMSVARSAAAVAAAWAYRWDG